MFWNSSWNLSFNGTLIFNLYQQKGQAPRIRNGCRVYVPQEAVHGSSEEEGDNGGDQPDVDMQE